jgi:hypothetical protein
MRRMAFGLLALVGAATKPSMGATPPAWQGDAGNSQHSAASPVAGQGLARLHWKTPVDLAPQYDGGELLIHYASPMITAANVVLLPVKTKSYGAWEIQALAGKTGAALWTLPTDYILPDNVDWVPEFPAQLTKRNRLYLAAAGGTVLVRSAPNTKTGTTVRQAFYGLSIFTAHTAAMTQAVMIDTPITSDAAGNIYFGFVVEGSNPANVTSGLARITAGGEGSWISAAAASGDPSMTEIAMGCAPALSANGKTVYVAVSNGSAGYLVALDSATLAPSAHVKLLDPASGQAAWITDLSSASPTIGPDGDVFYGVLENPYPNHDGRGWLLHFDAALAKLKTPGSFGWDDTVSVVPATALPASYAHAGGSTYYLMTKYNNYATVGPLGDGHNKLAILDPGARQQDEYATTPVTVMKEVQTVLGPTPYPGGAKGQVYEWCVNSAVVDAASGAVFAGSEDGKLYRWDLVTNTLSQSLVLNPPLGEAYTPTLIGADGTIYGINSATLYAAGK